MTVKRSIHDPSAAALGEKPDTQNETAIPIGSTRRRKPRRTARRPKPPALADSAPAIINEIPGVIARFHRHVRDCAECEQGGSRDGRLCLIGSLLARPRDLRIRARAPRMSTA